MIYLGGILLILGLPLLIVYALQDHADKNILWLRIGLLYEAFAIVFIIVGLLARLLKR